MSTRQLAFARDILGWLSAFCFFLFLACFIDGVVAGGRKDLNLNEVLPGQSLKFSGSMPQDTEKLSDLYIRSNSPALTVKLEEIFSGFWMGGQLWRAEATFAADMAPGDYTVSLSARNETSPKQTQTFTMRVFASPEAVQAASLSFTTRSLKLNPFPLAAASLLAGLVLALVSIGVSRQLARSLRSQGMAYIYRIMRTPEGQRIFFSLGANDGLGPGDTVEILDPRGIARLGSATVDAVRANDADSLLAEGFTVSISSIVRRPGSS